MLFKQTNLITMKKLILILCFIPVMAFSQTEEEKGHFQLGAGFSFGGFYPEDINNAVDEAFSGTEIETGTTDLFLNLGGRIFAGYVTKSNIGFEGFLEGAIAPKMVTFSDGSDDITYSLNRTSLGVKLTYALHMGKRNSIIFGAGPMYNILKFKFDGDEVLNATSVGAKFSVAYQFNYRHIAPRVFIDFDLAKAKDNGIEMNYSGGQFGIAFSGWW